jgi:hypothetical protein
VTTASTIVCLAYEASCNPLGNCPTNRIWEFRILSNSLAKYAMIGSGRRGISEIRWVSAQWIGYRRGSQVGTVPTGLGLRVEERALDWGRT